MCIWCMMRILEWMSLINVCTNCKSHFTMMHVKRQMKYYNFNWRINICFWFILVCRGDRQRLGSAIAAYLEYLNICATSYAYRNGLSTEDVRAQNTIARNWLDLDIFSMKKFLEDVIGPLRVPSHRRYLQYFSGLLSGKIRINSMPLYLRFITIESPPLWLQHEPIALQQAEWRSFIKIYEGLNCVFTSGKCTGNFVICLLFNEWNEQLRYNFPFCRHSCDTDFNTSIYLRNRPAPSAWRCYYSVLPNYNERTIHKLPTEANQCE